MLALSKELSAEEANELFGIVFGSEVSKGILAQWCNQGISALVRSMSEILFMCGNNGRAVVATLSILGSDIQHSENLSRDEVISKALEGLSIESGLKQ
ncbi:hypothetical protein PIB30_014472 [Stylosanthes scabra]|uniref:Uncharacterized protein n=1 Tax=Stylosanthes scabra TaxID=79078 RepID=A0ABU6W5C1_9FABA|nr:hypothetical protein [Stylosanthes scabra]